MSKVKFKNLLNTFSVSKHAKMFAVVPFAILLIAVIIVIALGATGGSYSDAVGIGIDFEGGSVITVTLGTDALGEKYAENRDRIVKTIEGIKTEQGQSVTVSYVQQQEASNVANSSIAFRYKNISNNDDEISALNERIRDAVDALYPDMPGNVKYESIGATAAQDLLSKAGIALAVSVALILLYIIIRFTLMSGFAAIIALIHDVVIMFALTVICRVQINSSYVAAMITIIAYSINNTIIIFDRCREMLKPLKGEKNIDYKRIGDTAVRDTMTRSIYTTLTTMITVIFLAILGSESIREFCVPIILGLIAGLYSSVFLATPLWAAMSASFDRTKAKYAKRNDVTYEKNDEEEESVATVAVSNSDEETKSEVASESKEPKKASANNKAKNNTIHKYSKKNLNSKKK